MTALQAQRGLFGGMCAGGCCMDADVTFKAGVSPRVPAVDSTGDQRPLWIRVANTAPTFLEEESMDKEKDTATSTATAVAAAANPLAGVNGADFTDVPPEFTDFVLSLVPAKQLAPSRTDDEDESLHLEVGVSPLVSADLVDLANAPGPCREALKACVRCFNAGVPCQVVLDNGACVLCVAQVTSAFRVLTLRVGEVCRDVPLGKVHGVYDHSMLEKEGIRTANDCFLDRLCLTLVLAGTQFVSFRFPSGRQRNYFAVGLQFLATAASRAEQREALAPPPA